MSAVHVFGEFSLDARERRLSRRGETVALAPKALDVLIALVEKSGRLVKKDELLTQVWPDSFVEEGILTVHVAALRKALGDVEPPRRYIETVSRSGYRFIATVEAQPGTASPPAVAYESFGQGRAHLLAGSMFEIPKAIACFRAAINAAPDYAAAHAGLALAHCAEAEYRLRKHSDCYADARGPALRALAMDEACADAQVALGTVLFLSDWNWLGAERSLQRALRLNPDHTEGCLIYGRLLESLGRLEAGLDTKLRALQRDPTSAVVRLQVSLSYFRQRRFDESIEWANKALESDPRHPHAREHIASAYWMKGDLDGWLRENIRHAEVHGVSADALGPVQAALARGGRMGVVRLLLEQFADGSVPEMQKALFSAEADDLHAAFVHLNRALDSRDPCLVDLAVGPQWDLLRADSARFDECLGRMGLKL